MANIGQFNPNAQAPLDNFISIPKGEWNAKIVDSKIEGSQDNPKLVLTFEVDEGSAKGGKADVHLFLWSPEKKGEISRRKMTSICLAMGINSEFNDTSVMHGRPLTLVTDIRFVAKNDGPGFMDFADIKGYKQYVGAGRAAGADANQPQAPVAAGAQASAPSLPTAPGLPSAPFQPAPVAAPSFAPPAAPAGFAPPVQGGFAPPMQPAQAAFAPPAPAGAWAPPAPGAAAPFGAPQFPGR